MSYNHHHPPHQMGIDPSNIYRPPVDINGYPINPNYYPLDMNPQYHPQDPHESRSDAPYPQSSFHASPPEPMPETPAFETTGSIYGAVYSGVPVFETMCRSVAVMRRRADSFLNATQILKVAGIDKGRRTKILEKEIQNGRHEKVQGGYGKYQGTWIPFERGVQLAQQYAVDTLLMPLFNYNTPLGLKDKTPTKEQVMAQSKPRGELAPTKKGSRNSQKKQGRVAIDYAFEEKLNRKRKKSSAEQHHQSTFSAPVLEADIMMQSDDQRYALSYQSQYYSPINEPMHQPYEAYPQAMQSQPTPPAERHRANIMALFMNDDDSVVADILMPQTSSDLDMDIILDDHGHSAVHWAAALGRISLLKMLIQSGANPNRLNYTGETPLMRAVMVSNNFERATFPALLNVLQDQIALKDTKKRTILHHTCIASSLKGLPQSCRYYMECLLEFVAHKNIDSMAVQRGRLVDLVDSLDVCGDTPINIAARIGNRQLVEQLLEMGADASIPNKVGLQPSDFGYDGQYSHNQPQKVVLND